MGIVEWWLDLDRKVKLVICAVLLIVSIGLTWNDRNYLVIGLNIALLLSAFYQSPD